MLDFHHVVRDLHVFIYMLDYKVAYGLNVCDILHTPQVPKWTPQTLESRGESSRRLGEVSGSCPVWKSLCSSCGETAAPERQSDECLLHF